MVASIAQHTRHNKAIMVDHQAAAEAAQGEATLWWGGFGISVQAEAAGGWLQQPAGPTGPGGEDVKKKAGQVPHFK